MSSRITRPDEVIHFPNNLDIEINYAKTKSYVKCKSYDIKLMGQGYVWHQIVVLHHGKVRCGRRIILDSIFAIVQGEEFFPIAYRIGPKEDRFLVRQCKEALDKLFEQSLRIQLSNGTFVALEIQLNVAEYKHGQISPTACIESALKYLFDNMECYNGEDGILNLTKFASRKEFLDIALDLGNRAHFDRVCKAIDQNGKFRSLNGIILRENQLTTVAPLSVFSVVFTVLDLRDNHLRSATRLCRDLNAVKADEILLAGNPITKTTSYPKCLEPITKNFKFIDSIPVANLSKDYTPLNYEVDVECDGYRIDWTNKSEIKKFDKSEDWHAVMIPDMAEEYTKEEIFDYFFAALSPDLSDVYPCYYKFTSGEHQFLVRQCYDQLNHLAEIYNLQLQVPRLVVPEPEDEFAMDSSPQVQVDKMIVFYLRMNVSAFSPGQVDPAECIEKALVRRFSAMDRLLNLENFQNTEGFENVIINLSSSNILKRILTYASRKFLASCVELKLGQNKIMSTDFAKALSIMCNLKAIDLSNNWLQDLNDINQLQVLNLRSLCLDGNPLCSKYPFAANYIKEVRALYPGLQLLDNVDISSLGYLRPQKNYLCDINGYDFVEEFVSNYFNKYDKSERSILTGLYHPNAMFTMTFHFVPAQDTTQNYNRILKYDIHARNILKFSEHRRAYASVHAGHVNVMTLLMKLPKTTHDVFTFSTDTIAFNKDMVVINVSGVFMDHPTDIIDPDILMAFSRTFVLAPVQHFVGVLEKAVTYQIINEQLSVFNPTATQKKNAFKYANCDDKLKAEPTLDDKKNMLAMLKMITNLKTIWCTRCLDAGNWDFEQSLAKFTEYCENNEIPDTAFY